MHYTDQKKHFVFLLLQCAKNLTNSDRLITEHSKKNLKNNALLRCRRFAEQKLCMLLPARRYAGAVFVVNCYRVSVLPSVTSLSCTKTAKRRITQTTQYK